MKLRLTIQLELPDECDSWSDPELQEAVWGSYVHYNTLSHLKDAMKWCAESHTNPNCATSKKIQDHHDLWADISQRATWSVERVAGAGSGHD
jgi:hypothetical protein